MMEAVCHSLAPRHMVALVDDAFPSNTKCTFQALSVLQF
jgi:hypothetical protein